MLRLSAPPRYDQYYLPFIAKYSSTPQHNTINELSAWNTQYCDSKIVPFWVGTEKKEYQIKNKLNRSEIKEKRRAIMQSPIKSSLEVKRRSSEQKRLAVLKMVSFDFETQKSKQKQLKQSISSIKQDFMSHIGNSKSIQKAIKSMSTKKHSLCFTQFMKTIQTQQQSKKKKNIRTLKKYRKSVKTEQNETLIKGFFNRNTIHY